MDRLRILSIGAGAIGTYIGGSLALAGNDLVFLERPETAKLINQIRIKLPDQIKIIPHPKFAVSIQQALTLGPFDVSLFALKSYDTQNALKDFAPFAEQLPPFLCLQNGVENEEKIAEIFGPEKVIPATVTSAIGKTGPGQIILEKFRGIGISSLHLLSEKLQLAFNLAQLNAELFDDPSAMKWSKMLTNLISNATSAILALPPAEIYSDPKLFQIEVAQLKETLKVMEALKIPLVDLPGTPVRLLAKAINWIPQAISRPLLKKQIVGGRGDKMPSFYIDMQSGKPNSEVEFLNGAVSRWGENLNISTPANTFLNRTLLGIVKGQIPKYKYQHNPNQFIQDFSKFKD
jgi:2-dehydropantoate 2-reductase